jgi:hypothetical protein
MRIRLLRNSSEIVLGLSVRHTWGAEVAYMIVAESRLEGGVNRAKLKFTNLNTNYKPG